MTEWLGYLEHATPELLGTYTANTGKGGCTIFAQILYERYGANFMGAPWCATFVFAVHERPEALGKPCAGVRTLWRRMRRRGRLRSRAYTPRPGDLVFCYTAPGRVGHVGIVERVLGGAVVSIDGNTVDPSGAFQPGEGGAVARRVRDKNDPIIAGYAAIGKQEYKEETMEDNIFTAKVLLTGIIAAGSAIWGWFGWLVLLWVICMVMDYVTGTLAAMKKGETYYDNGLWSKERVYAAVHKWITPDEYKEITGEECEEA